MNEAKVRDSIKTFLQKMRAVSDEIPEELAQDALEMTEEVKDALEEEVEVKDEEIIEEKTEDEEEEETKDEEPKENIEEIVKDAVNKALCDAGIIKDEDLEKLDELTGEIEEKAEDEGEIESEEAVTIEPEKITDSANEVKKVISKVKPIIAGMKDKKQKKILTDSIVKLAKMNYKTTSDYGSILKTVEANKHSMDSKVQNDFDLGKDIAKKYNPHYKEEN